MKLLSGLFCEPMVSVPAVFNIGDIAHALSNLGRFAGHSDRFFSAAEHAVLVSRELAEYGPETRLYGLLNGAPAAYLGDLPDSIKTHLPLFNKAERRIREAVMASFNVTVETSASLVEEAQGRVLAMELRELLNASDEEILNVWGLSPPGNRDQQPIGLLPFEAHGTFLKEYEKITRELKEATGLTVKAG